MFTSRWMVVGSMSALMLVSGACSTKKFVRESVNNRANEINAKMDEKDAQLESSIQQNAGQVNELSGVTREHGTQIAKLDTGLKATDEKAASAMSTGTAAQTSANKALSEIEGLNSKFGNRNHMEQKEESAVLFRTGSAKLNKDDEAKLNEFAEKVKQNPDAVLVLEGRTDATGDPTTNIQLGEKRIATVERTLVVGQSVPVHQIYKMSYGEDNPSADNKTREGRAQNRAVILRLFAPAIGEAGNSGGTMTSSNQ